MNTRQIHSVVNFLIAAVWVANGLFCKVLNLVPRHRQIVARILGDEWAPLLTTLIGIAEVVMAAWVLSRVWSRFNAVVQMSIIATMNVIEMVLAPDLLLWGQLNALFALMFIALIGVNEFVLKKDAR